MLHKVFFLLFVGLIGFSCLTHAQTKPKRDASKDRSVIIQKQQEEREKAAALAAERKKKQAVEAQRRRSEQVKQTPKLASYLYVDNKKSVSKSFLSNSGSETFDIETDGKEWSINLLPSWCRIHKGDGKFTLFYNENLAYSDRNGTFEIKSDNQTVVVNISQKGKVPPKVDVNIFAAAIAFAKSSYSNIYIDTSFYLRGVKGQKVLLVLYVKDKNNNYIKATPGQTSFADSSKDVCVTRELVLNGGSEHFAVGITLPKNVLNLHDGKNQLKFELYFYQVDINNYIPGFKYTLPFIAKVKKGKVKIKKTK